MSYTPPPPPPPGAGGYAVPPTNQKAMWSLILGIVSIVCCGLLAGIPAIILGTMAQREVAASGGTQSGDGMAKAGVILGWISVAMTVLLLIFVVTTGVLTSGLSGY